MAHVMLLFRSLALGLLAAAVTLLASRPSTVIVMPAPSAAAPPVVEHEPTVPDITIVDFAHTLDPRELPSLVRLEQGERVVAVSDRSCDSLATSECVAAAARASDYVDVDVRGPRGGRRVVLLRH